MHYALIPGVFKESVIADLQIVIESTEQNFFSPGRGDSLVLFIRSKRIQVYLEESKQLI